MNDEAAMRLALAEAMKGVGRTHPNPSVGAVVVKAGRVIGAGFTSPPGGPHAERHALAQAGSRAKGATLYCTLEPCNHHGRTPPCTEAIIAAGVARVVFAAKDPNPHVPGDGAKRLRKAGLEVTGGVLADESEALNRPFFKAMRTGRAYVTAKVGMTLDGKLATSTGKSKWITSEASRRRAHELRDRVDAILVGAGTVALDDPELTTRLPDRRGRTPVRLVLDATLRSPRTAKLYDTRAGRTIVVTRAKDTRALARRGVEVWKWTSLDALLKRLCQEGLLHLLVEGGATVHQRFLEQGLVDELMLFVAPKLFGGAALTWTGGLDVRDPAKALQFRELRAEPVGDDLLLTARK